MSGWLSPTGFVDPSAKWSDEDKAYDESTTTFAYEELLSGPRLSTYLELTHAGLWCNKVQIWLKYKSPYFSNAEVDVYYGSAWHNIYDAFDYNEDDWTEINIGSTQRITAARIRISITASGNQAQVYEFDFWKVDVTHEGAATLSGIGSLAALGGKLLLGTVTLTGSGSLSAIGELFLLGAANLLGVGSLAAKAIMAYTGKVTLTGTGLLATIGQRILHGIATLSGIGLLTALGYIVTVKYGYILEVHASNGDLISMLKNPLRIRYVRALNEPHQLAFQLPADDDALDDITLSNEVWLRNLKDNTVVRKFKLIRRNDRRT